METWRIRQSVPYRITADGHELLIGLADIDTEKARLTVHSDGEWVAGYDLTPGVECEIGGKRWKVNSIAGPPRRYVELEEQP
ncbi:MULTISPECIES: hypothetical protein [unclassified Kribbella]|uniref:hypothetical protein n=1 Tax=unclassified Kribbella TaxID=2644121 RepID=UPI00301AFD84